MDKEMKVVWNGVLALGLALWGTVSLVMLGLFAGTGLMLLGRDPLVVLAPVAVLGIALAFGTYEMWRG